jgi:hypothetical protein
MGHTPKSRCPVCDKNMKLEWKGQGWVFPDHAKNGWSPACKGTGRKASV